jgi:hypothetical protein
MSTVPLRDLFRRPEETKACVACEAALPMSANFCGYCGVRLDDPDAQPLYIVDRATGLFNDRFIRPLLEDELVRAHRYERMLGVLLVRSAPADGIPETSEWLEDALKLTATAVVGALRDVDTPGVLKRRPPTIIALLPDTDIAGTGYAATRVLETVDRQLGPRGKVGVGIVCVQPDRLLRADAVIDAGDRSLRAGRPELLGR